MFKLFARIILLFVIVLAISLLISKFMYKPMQLAPYTYGSELLHLKREFLKKNKNKFNTLFIGSSTILMGVNPEAFDSSIKTGSSLHSFNFGLNWLGSSELFYVLDNLTNIDSLKFKYVFVELSKIKGVNYVNLHNTRAKYWYTPENYVFTIKAIIDSKFSILVKLDLFFTHTINYLDKLLNLGYVHEALNFKERSQKIEQSIREKKYDYNGYGMSASEKIDLKALANDEMVLKKNINFTKDSTGLTLLSNTSKMCFEENENHSEVIKNNNKIYSAKINEMIDDYKSKGIYLIFFIPPRGDKSYYKEVLPVFFNVDPKHRIELADSRKYPELYYSKYSTDEGHLNSAGAVVFSKLLGEKYNELKIGN